MKMYLDDFDSWAEVLKQFAAPDMPEPEHVFATYTYEDYSGSALVIYSKPGNKFGMVEGGHCSCYGLEGQWEPTEHEEADIRRMIKGADWGIFHRNRNNIRNFLNGE